MIYTGSTVIHKVAVNVKLGKGMIACNGREFLLTDPAFDGDGTYGVGDGVWCSHCRDREPAWTLRRRRSSIWHLYTWLSWTYDYFGKNARFCGKVVDTVPNTAIVRHMTQCESDQNTPEKGIENEKSRMQSGMPAMRGNAGLDH